MDKFIGMLVAFVGCLLLLIGNWTRDASIFTISSVMGVPAIYLGVRMLLG